MPNPPPPAALSSRLTGQSTDPPHRSGGVGEKGSVMRAAAIQLNSTADKARNLEVAERLVSSAAADGAELVVLPEKWNLLGGAEALIEGAEAIDAGPTIEAARGWARDLGIHLVAGSIAERPEGSERAGDSERLFNTSC